MFHLKEIKNYFNEFVSCMAFTLIEILVAVTIILIFSVLIISSVSAIQKNSRDAQRKSDLAKIQGAIEQYHIDHGYLPNNLGSGGCIATSSPVFAPGSDFTSCTGADPANCDASKIYLKNVPGDPKIGTAYGYAGIENYGGICDGPTDGGWDNCTNYCLGANLESGNPNQENKCQEATIFENCEPTVYDVMKNYSYQISQ